MGETVLAPAEAIFKVEPSAWAAPGGGLHLRSRPSPQKVALAALVHVGLLAGAIWLSHLLAKQPPEPGEVAVNLVFASSATGPQMPVAAVPSPREHLETPTPPPATPPTPAVPTPAPAPATSPREHVETQAPPTPAPASQQPTTEALPLPPVAPPPPRSMRRSVAARPTPARPALNFSSEDASSAAAAPAGPSAVGAAAAALVPARPVAGMESDRSPVYPESARRRGEQGRVVLRVSVAPDGDPLQVIVGHSSGFAILDDAALDAVRRWRFVPATRNGRPVQAIAEVPILFRLEE